MHRLTPGANAQRWIALSLTGAALLAAAGLTFAVWRLAATPPRIDGLDARVLLTVPTRAATPSPYPTPTRPTPEPTRPVATAAPALAEASKPPAPVVVPATATPTEAERVRRALKSVLRIQTDAGTGTGFLVRGKSGPVVITNRHVIDGARSISLIAPDGSAYRSSVLQHGGAVDVAGLSAGNLSLPVLSAGDDHALRAGDPLYVVGFPLGTRLLGDATITRGVVSGRRTADGVDYVQTDAAMNHGNSGGPVLNAAGEVVGLATWGFNPSVATGINFALPWSTARAVLNQLLA